MHAHSHRQHFIRKWKRAETHDMPAQQPPTWLELAHKKLDEAVFGVYDWKSDLSDEGLCVATGALDR
jgi:hypothetical protein